MIATVKTRFRPYFKIGSISSNTEKKMVWNQENPLIQLKAKTSNGWGNVEQVDLQLQQNQVKLLLQPSKGSGLRATKLAQPTTKMHHLWLFKAHSNITKHRTNGWYFFWKSFYIYKIYILKRLSSYEHCCNVISSLQIPDQPMVDPKDIHKCI